MALSQDRTQRAISELQSALNELSAEVAPKPEKRTPDNGLKGHHPLLRCFNRTDWYGWAGCETRNPKIAETAGLTVIVDGPEFCLYFGPNAEFVTRKTESHEAALALAGDFLSSLGVE